MQLLPECNGIHYQYFHLVSVVFLWSLFSYSILIGYIDNHFKYCICLYFWGNFNVLFKGQFCEYLFSWLWIVCTHFVDPPLEAIMSFINSIRRYGRLVMEKRKLFSFFAVSVMKDKEIVHILIVPSSCSKLKVMI